MAVVAATAQLRTYSSGNGEAANLQVIQAITVTIGTPKSRDTIHPPFLIVISAKGELSFGKGDGGALSAITETAITATSAKRNANK